MIIDYPEFQEYLELFLAEKKRKKPRFTKEDLDKDIKIKESVSQDFSEWLESRHKDWDGAFRNYLEWILKKYGAESVEDLVSEKLKNRIENIKNGICDQLKSGELSFKDFIDRNFNGYNWRYRSYIEEKEKKNLDETTLDDYIESLSYDLGTYWENISGNNLYDEVYEAVYMEYPELDEIRMLDSFQEILEQIQDIFQDLFYGLETNFFTEDRIRSLILQNPRYAYIPEKIREAKLREEQLRQKLLTTIPEFIRDAYPLARQIKRRFILYIGPTNSGKTHQALEKFCSAKTGVYLAPLRLLALEVFENTISKGISCSLLTGEEEDIRDDAEHISETIEMLDYSKHYSVAVIDEAQMIADKNRGGAWTAAILGLNADEIHICMASYAEELITSLIEYCGDEIVEIHHLQRRSDLVYDTESFSFPTSVQKGDALIVFSRKKVILCAAELKSLGISSSIIYGALPYDTRKAETERFLRGETEVLVATDAVGMGLNLPIQRVCFLEKEKYDGTSMRDLLPEEVQQIAGRAGRKDQYDIGLYTDMANRFSYKKYNTVVNPILYARLHFPGFLVNVEGKLSDILVKWQGIHTESLFLKSDHTEELRKCICLEKIFGSNELNIEEQQEIKTLIFKLIRIPVNTNNNDLYEIWVLLSRMVYKDSKISLNKIEKFIDVETNRHSRDADTESQCLEQEYQKLDLIYHFIRIFGDRESREEDKLRLKNMKKEISERLTELLLKKDFKKNRCKCCGKNMGIFHPYAYCDSCYQQRRVWWDDY